MRDKPVTQQEVEDHNQFIKQWVKKKMNKKEKSLKKLARIYLGHEVEIQYVRPNYDESLHE